MNWNNYFSLFGRKTFPNILTNLIILINLPQENFYSWIESLVFYLNVIYYPVFFKTPVFSNIDGVKNRFFNTMSSIDITYTNMEVFYF